MTPRTPLPTVRDGVPIDGPVSVRDIAVDGEIVRVVGIGLACCALEVVEGVASLPTGDAIDREPGAHVIVMGGTISLGIKAKLDRIWADTPDPKIAVAFGVCTISGGPYWDSYTVLPGLRGEYGQAVEVPGCPPRPDVLQGAVEAAARHVLAASSAGSTSGAGS